MSKDASLVKPHSSTGSECSGDSVARHYNLSQGHTPERIPKHHFPQQAAWLSCRIRDNLGWIAHKGKGGIIEVIIP